MEIIADTMSDAIQILHAQWDELSDEYKMDILEGSVYRTPFKVSLIKKMYGKVPGSTTEMVIVNLYDIRDSIREDRIDVRSLYRFFSPIELAPLVSRWGWELGGVDDVSVRFTDRDGGEEMVLCGFEDRQYGIELSWAVESMAAKAREDMSHGKVILQLMEWRMNTCKKE